MRHGHAALKPTCAGEWMASWKTVANVSSTDARVRGLYEACSLANMAAQACAAARGADCRWFSARKSSRSCTFWVASRRYVSTADSTESSMPGGSHCNETNKHQSHKSTLERCGGWEESSHLGTPWALHMVRAMKSVSNLRGSIATSWDSASLSPAIAEESTT